MAMADFKIQTIESEKTGKDETRIGELLVQAGKIGSEDVERITEIQQREKGLRFGELAVKLRIASDKDIQNALAKQTGQISVSPQGSLSNEILAALDHEGVNVERFRAIRSQLLLTWFKDNKSLLLTSAVGGEGVSHLAAALAVVIASLPKRVLLIDANLRAPRQHELFQVDQNAPGLGAVLEGCAGQEIISHVNHFDSLSVLQAGLPPKNPAELLSRDVFSNLLSECAKRYDIILIDGPAATAPELPILARYAEGVVLTANTGRSNVKDVRKVAKLAKNAGAEMVGAILNHK